MMDPAERWLVFIVVMIVILFGASLYPVFAHDHDHPELDAWYATLMQPDNPSMSCCGKSDAYWCDDYFARGDKAFCRITDDRPDGPLKRPHIPIGTEIEIPNHKLKWDRGNPVGHAVVFVSPMLHVYCYVQASGS
jgi:hypothetical protein